MKTPKNSTINFDKTCNVETYNSFNNVGLSIIRPNKKEIELDKITKNNVTVFYPFIRNCESHDEPDSVALEYMYSKEQSIKISR